MNRSAIKLTSLLLVLTLLISACSGSSNDEDERKTTESIGGTVELQPLFYSETSDGYEGGVRDITIELSESKKDAISVAISDDEVEGSGAQWEAAAWNAMAVSTLVTGASLNKRQFIVDASGFIDGPSAGALMTVGAISLIRGDKIKRNVTMTGTINPDGTVGPVGGIQYKLEGAAEANKRLVLIPAGQSVELDENGREVDLIELGEDLGIRVREVSSIYEAYEAFTGVELPKFDTSIEPELTDSQIRALSEIVEQYSDNYIETTSTLTSFPAGLESLQEWLDAADLQYQEAQDLIDKDQPAAALSRIRESYGYAIAINAIIDYFETEAISGAEVAEDVIKELDDTFIALFDDLSEELEDYDVKNLADAATLIDAYGTLTIGVGIETIAVDLVNGSSPGEYNPVNAITYIATAIAGVEIQSKVFDEFSNDNGPDLDQVVKPEVVADFFRKSADANIAAFSNSIVKEIQDAAQGTQEEAIELLKQADPTVALVFNSQEVERLAEEVYGDIDNLAYAQLGAAVELYSRSSQLIAGYYSLGVPTVIDGQVEINSFRSEKAFKSAKDLAKEQLAGVSRVLEAKNVEPIFVASAYELANYQESDENPGEAIRTLSIYWKGFVAGRVLTYLGGFPRAGLKN